MVVVLAALGRGDRSRWRTVQALGAIAVLFLLVAFGGHTPFYGLWYEVMPMMKKVRAPGMAFFLVALPVAVFAGFGTDRLLRGEVPRRALIAPLSVLGGLALFGVAGVLQSLGTLFAAPEQAARLAANAGALQAGALRLLFVVLMGGGRAVGGVARASPRRGWPPRRWLSSWSAICGASTGCSSISAEPASELFRDDAVTSRLGQDREPFRVLDVGVYQGSYLMAHDIQTMLGYHGNEIRFYDELLGGKGQWRYAGNPNLIDLLGVRYLLLPEAQAGAGISPGAGSRDDHAGYARRPARAGHDTALRPGRCPAPPSCPRTRCVPTVIDPRFPFERDRPLSRHGGVSPSRFAAGRSRRPHRSAPRWRTGRPAACG